MIDLLNISEEEMKNAKGEDDSLNINEEEKNSTSNEDTFDPSTLESSFVTLVSDSRLSGFERASQTLKELPRDAILQNKQNDAILQNKQNDADQEEEEK